MFIDRDKLTDDYQKEILRLCETIALFLDKEKIGIALSALMTLTGKFFQYAEFTPDDFQEVMDSYIKTMKKELKKNDK